MKKSNVLHYVVLVLATIIFIAPLLFVLIYSFSNGWMNLLPNEFPNTQFWHVLIFESPTFWENVGRSIILCVVPIIVSLICMILAMYTIVMHSPKMDGIVQTISMLPYTLRGVVLAISILSLYAGKGTIFSNRIVMLFCVYAVIILPFVYRGLRNNLYAINAKQIVEAAELLGASGLYTFFRIIVPNMLTGIAVSALLSFGAIFTDYSIVKLVGGNRFETAQTFLYYQQKSGYGPQTAAYIITVFVIILTIATLSYRLQNRKVKTPSDGSKGE